MKLISLPNLRTRRPSWLVPALFLSCQLTACGDSGSSPDDSAEPGESNDQGGTKTFDGDDDSASAADPGNAGSDSSEPGTSQNADISLTVTEADVATVGIATFTTDKTLDSAAIEFGREGMVEYTAPVDLSEPDHRTLLLGMKQGQTYTVRVVASGAGTNYVSADVSFEAGFLSNNLPAVTMTEEIPGASYGGFTVSCNGVGGAAPGQDTAASWAFIFDKDGDYVWAYDLADTPARGCSRARMSHDGKHLWAGTFSNTTSQNTTGALIRVTMDGSEITTYTAEPTGGDNIQVENINFRHHDFNILPGGNILYGQRKDGNDASPDEIRELDIETGASTLLFDEATLTGITRYHTNYVTYLPALQAFSFSLRHSNTIVLATYPEGDVLGIVNGDEDEFGVNPQWTAQHGHQFLDDALLVFNNTSGGPANVLEMPIDLQAKTAGEIATYTGGPTSIAFGDVERLPNGNTFITYSNAGQFHEIDLSGQLIKTFTTDPLGYAEHRIDLYGPPAHLE
jgi:hypothetical protein